MTNHIRTEDPAPYGTAPAPDRQPRCRWTLDAQDGYWATSCGHGFVFNDGGPPENGFRFCPYCGRAVLIATDDDSDRNTDTHTDTGTNTNTNTDTDTDTDTDTGTAGPPPQRPAPPGVSNVEHQALLDQWNALVRASGSATHGGAVGHVAGLRRALEAIQDWDRACQQETDRCALPEPIRTLLQQFSPRS